MKLVLLLLVVGIIFYCSEKNVFKKLKQTGGDDGNQVAVIGALTAACALIAGVVYYLTTQKCTCKHGTAQTDTDKCSGDDKENCTDCDDGFTLNDTKCNKDDSKKGCDAITCPPEKNLKKKPGKPTCAATPCKVTECCDCTSKDYKINSTKQKCEKDQDKYKCNSQKCEKSTDADAMSKSECEEKCVPAAAGVAVANHGFTVGGFTGDNTKYNGTYENTTNTCKEKWAGPTPWKEMVTVYKNNTEGGAGYMYHLGGQKRLGARWSIGASYIECPTTEGSYHPSVVAHSTGNCKESPAGKECAGKWKIKIDVGGGHHKWNLISDLTFVKTP